MSVNPENDGDGVDRDDQSAEVHENTRTSAEGVEETPAGTDGRDAAAGLIGNGMAVDPRNVAQR
jgi:hypothetical protein